MSVLVIASHPDDEVLGCGGTIARLAQQGTAVYIAILGEGITSRAAAPDQSHQPQLKKLHEHAHQAAKLLGAADLFMHQLPDNRFDTVALLDIVKEIESLIDRLGPDTVYTQHGGDLNVDHVATFRATLTATRPTAGGTVKSVYSYEVASSTEWSFGQFAPAFAPQRFVDITQTLDVKIQAMQTYESESRPSPHPRSPESLRSLAAWRGSQAGVEAAEAFTVVRQVR